ncbi:hypothetical protein AGE29_01035 (plasmid) [Clostridium botulinum]|uniref:Uncharacterized protein n=1 Tax=Clostridium botulinum (strain 657 / Type Ba4) TaxID=515621 RepID=A0A3F2ZVX4_CLOB6|nr:hypothetical protein [Clostridium botulinum]ACQ51420.1 hypothetical protein CLJ_0200 [Clostridium botulinum Ba4 str. 657]AJE13253.1 putative membrane protein [Clostridium botulinum CDC_1436]AXG90425.1 hypothetical protein AGE29_01035 [Clostridium botulinum]MBO0529021.1 hypothetical protein [Clostridium botulinum]MBO0534482.1 hypothetical protein [Clostridium botulinum]
MNNNLMIYTSILTSVSIFICLQMLDKINIKKFFFIKNIDRSIILSKIQRRIENRLNLFTIDINKSKTVSYLIIELILFNSIINIILSFFINDIWYTSLLNIILSSAIPIVITKNIMENKYRKVIKELNNAFTELQYWLFRTNNVVETINKTSENLTDTIKKPFLTLSLYLNSDDSKKAFSTFKDTFKNIYVNQLTEILESYLEFGGNIEQLNIQITDINTTMQSENMFYKRITERLFKFKLASIVMIICSFVSKNLLLKLFPAELLQQTGISISTSKFTFIALYFILLYFVIDLLERF